jgi:hypothetical protein
MASLALTSCSLLVHFDTLLPCDGGACEDASADAAAPDAAQDTTVITPDSGSRQMDAGRPETAADVTAPDVGPCSAKADGFQWGPSDVDRCCGGASVTTDQNANCGGCGIVCQDMQHCGISPLSNGQYLCLGCVEDTDCWSGHCVQDELDSGVDAGSHCAVESDDGGDCLGVCPSGTAPTGPPPCCPTGSRCVMPIGVLLNYCTYDDAG